jgi:hypothetical protein
MSELLRSAWCRSATGLPVVCMKTRAFRPCRRGSARR